MTIAFDKPMKTVLLFALLFFAAPAFADAEATPRLLCLESLDVRETQPVVSQVAPRAQVHADVQTNCFVIIAHEDRFVQIERIIAQMETQAQTRN